MSEYCIICECEPVTLEGWAKINGGQLDTEYLCPWCIKEMHENKDRKRVERLTAALSIYKDDLFSRSFLESMLK